MPLTSGMAMWGFLCLSSSYCCSAAAAPSRPAEPRCRARPAVPAHRLGVGLARQRQDGSGRAGSRRFRSLEHSRNGQRNAFAHRLGIRRAAGSAAARPLPFLLHAHQGVFSTRVVLCPAVLGEGAWRGYCRNSIFRIPWFPISRPDSCWKRWREAGNRAIRNPRRSAFANSTCS